MSSIFTLIPIALTLVVIDNFDIYRAIRSPGEANPVSLAKFDSVLPYPVGFQFLNLKSWNSFQVVQTISGVDSVQNQPSSFPELFWTGLFSLFGRFPCEDISSSLILKLYHNFIVYTGYVDILALIPTLSPYHLRIYSSASPAFRSLAALSNCGSLPGIWRMIRALLPSMIN